MAPEYRARMVERGFNVVVLLASTISHDVKLRAIVMDSDALMS